MAVGDSPWQRTRSDRLFAILGVLAFALAAGALAYKVLRPPSAAGIAMSASSPLEGQTTTMPEKPGGSTQSASSAPTPKGALVYECFEAGARVFSDRPCATKAKERRVDLTQQNSYTPVPVRAIAPTAPQTQGNSNSPPRTDMDIEAVENRRVCSMIEVSIDQINARMRAGYSSAEGERLRARWHELKDEYYAQRCGR